MMSLTLQIKHSNTILQSFIVKAKQNFPPLIMTMNSRQRFAQAILPICDPTKTGQKPILGPEPKLGKHHCKISHENASLLPLCN